MSAENNELDVIRRDHLRIREAILGVVKDQAVARESLEDALEQVDKQTAMVTALLEMVMSIKSRLVDAGIPEEQS